MQVETKFSVRTLVKPVRNALSGWVCYKEKEIKSGVKETVMLSSCHFKAQVAPRS